MEILTPTELASQFIVELPDRELLGGVIDIDGPINLFVLNGILNGSFNNWSISALNDNHVTVTVTDNLSQNDVDVFCNQVITLLSAQCYGTVGDP